jgi:hypothetical protein
MIMATFNEIFAKRRKELGAGKTFVWSKSEGGDGKSYSTDYATEKKSSGTGTKPKAKPAGLNPQSGAARSTAGKVKPASTVKRPAKADEISGQKAAPSLSGASRSIAGKVTPKMSMMDKAKADAKARREASQSAGRGNNKKTTTTTVNKNPAKKPLERLGEFLSGGGMFGANRRAKETKKALGARR